IRDFHVTGVQTCALPIFAALGQQVAGLLDQVFRRLRQRAGVHAQQGDVGVQLELAVAAAEGLAVEAVGQAGEAEHRRVLQALEQGDQGKVAVVQAGQDRKSTRLNSSHVKSSYAVFR